MELDGEPLKIAAQYGNVKAVHYLIEYGADVDYPGGWHDTTPLIHACWNNDLDVVNILLQNNADINLCDNGHTPLTACCWNGNLELVNRLLSNNPAPDINQKIEDDGVTPLGVAIYHCHSAIVNVLISKGATLSFERESLYKLCKVGNIDLVRQFLSECTDAVDVDEKTLESVVRTENVALMDLLLLSNNVSKSMKTLKYALKCACMVGSEEIVQMLIHYDNGNFWKSTKINEEAHLYLAVRNQHVAIVKLLIAHGCDPAMVLCKKETMRSSELLSFLLKHDLPQSSLNGALMTLCRAGYTYGEHFAGLLLDRSADVNYRDTDQISPILAATLKPSTSLVKLLLSRGADTNLPDIYKRTPLLVAYEMDHHEIASLLIYNEAANLHKAGIPAEKCPLWVACMHGQLDLVSLLLDNDANPNISDETGLALVKEAHRHMQHEVVRILLEYGAYPDALNNVSLREACSLGYAERAKSVYHGANIDDLQACIIEACNKGFCETALEIIIDMQDQHQKKACYEQWKKHCDVQNTAVSQSPGIESDEAKTIWQSFSKGDMKKMLMLIQAGHDPNEKNTSGLPLLHACIQHYYIPVVFALCDCSTIDVNQVDELGRSALFCCLRWPVVLYSEHHICLFDYLLDKGRKDIC